MALDSLGTPGFPFSFLATGEDNAGPNPSDALLIYTGLDPGTFYYIYVDGANNTSGRFCLSIKEEPDLWMGLDTCQSFIQTTTGFSADEAWRNLYAGDGSHVIGALIGAIYTVDNLGQITISTEVLSDVPMLPNGQKILPRYFNIETQYAPINPLTLRLFFTESDLEAFNITPLVTGASPFQLGLTHYDGDQEDCDPNNNSLTGGLSVTASQATLVGGNGMFYLEAVFDDFSEFGASLPNTVGVSQEITQNLQLSIRPNPFDVGVQLSFYSPYNGDVDYQLFDVLSKTVRKGKIPVQFGETNQRLDFPDLKPGMYQLILFRNGQSVGHARVVKI